MAWFGCPTVKMRRVLCERQESVFFLLLVLLLYRSRESDITVSVEQQDGVRVAEGLGVDRHTKRQNAIPTRHLDSTAHAANSNLLRCYLHLSSARLPPRLCQYPKPSAIKLNFIRFFSMYKTRIWENLSKPCVSSYLKKGKQT